MNENLMTERAGSQPARVFQRHTEPWAALPRLERTVRQEREVQAAEQALLRAEFEARTAAKGLGLKPACTEAFLERARCSLQTHEGRVRVVSREGKVLRAADDGGPMGVAEWVRGVAQERTEWFNPPPGPEFPEPEAPPRNPFAKGSWNLTEQMRMIRQDPERAQRLKTAAVGE